VFKRYLQRNFLPLSFLLPLLICGSAFSQSRETSPGRFATTYVDTLRWSGSDTLSLSRQFVAQGHITISVGTMTLTDSLDFLLSSRDGILILTSKGRQALTRAAQTILVVTYQALPFRFRKLYQNRFLVIRPDTVTGDSLAIAASSAPMTMETFFGKELQKNGYIGRGITLGTNRDLSINSGFRLQLSGNLSEDISVVAAMTDENTPIQPEGNTKTLQELDKVFIKLAGKNMSATLGDYVLGLSGTEFGRLNRKVSGVLAEGLYDKQSASVAYASQKGSFHTVQFNGTDGMQGPYRLTGKNGEQGILVLAGTEKIYLDGALMTRGETNDYIIEYASGEIFFKPKRLITSYSRITVDFEYAERQYPKSLIAAQTNSSLFSDKIRLTAGYTREADDQDNPIDFQFTDADKSTLSLAGADQQKASSSGIHYVGIDSAKLTGAGQYVRVDTSIAGQAYTFYRYAPGSDSATYLISYSYVGAGKGDYRRKTYGIVEFAGVLQGDYAPVRLLPMPTLKQVGNVKLSMQPLAGFTIAGEAAMSDFNRNRFSSLNGVNIGGNAFDVRASLKRAVPAVGDFDLVAHVRSVSSSFSPIDRMNDIEFNRKWDLATVTADNEVIKEANLSYAPFAAARIAGGVGTIERGAFSSTRYDGNISFNQQMADKTQPLFDYSLESIHSEDGANMQHGNWFRQRGSAAYTLFGIKPRLRFEQERRLSYAGSNDSLSPASLALLDVMPGVELPEFWNMAVSADLGFRTEDAVAAGTLQRQTINVLQQYSLSLRTWNDLSGNATIVIRDRKYTDTFKTFGNKDLQTILVKSQLRYAPLKGAVACDLLYNVSTERTSKLQRVFLSVPIGQGNYTYLGDLNHNGVQDESEFQLTRFDGNFILVTMPTDQLFPVIDLMTSARVAVKAARFFEGAPQAFWTDVLRALSTETFFRVEEKNQSEKTSDLYLLHFSAFLNDSTTLLGFQNIRHDLYVFDGNPDFSLRLRFDQNRGFSQYALASERSYKRERSLRLRSQLITEVGMQIDYALNDDVVAAPPASYRGRSIYATNLLFDFSYRPVRNIEVGFRVGSKNATDGYPSLPVVAKITTLALRTTLSFSGPARIRAELESNDISLSHTPDYIPFELTDGKPDGKSIVLRLDADYRITSFLQGTVSYLGRNGSGSSFLHTMRAEVKAFF
jgi:hypothetical protein